MTFRLLPRDVKFFDLFLEDGENLALAAGRLREVFEQFDRLDERIAEIQGLEHRGDEIDREINRRLADAFVTPFDREDIHDLTVKLDDVLDGIQAIAETLAIYDVSVPTAESKRLAAIIAEQSVELVAILRRLDGLKGIDRHLEAVHDLEHEADGLSRAAIGRLFREAWDPLDVIKWRDLYAALEETIDAAEDAAEVVERMNHKSS